MVTKATTKPKKTGDKNKLKEIAKKMVKPKEMAKKVSEYAKFQSEKARKVKKTTDSTEKQKQLRFRKKVLKKTEIKELRKKLYSEKPDKLFKILLKALVDLKKQLDKSVTPKTDKEREKVILSLYKVHIIHEIFKMKHVVYRKQTPVFKLALDEISKFFKMFKKLTVEIRKSK